MEILELKNTITNKNVKGAKGKKNSGLKDRALEITQSEPHGEYTL